MTGLSFERQCELAYELWTGICSAIVFTTLKRHGQETIVELERRSVNRHQSSHFLQGIKKLGLDTELNDVIRCAKYHYFSNTLGGLPMHYVEESAHRVWIRYLAPFWMGDSPFHPASGPAVLNSAFGRAPYHGWHANNGAYLNNDRLVFVQTQSLVDGDPWDGGYFTLHDTPLAPGKGYLRRIGEWGPRFDPAAAPALPHATWPQERRSKAQRSYIIDFTASRCATLLEMMGSEETALIIEDAVKIVLIQRTRAIAAQFGFNRIRSARDAAQFFARVASVSGDASTVTDEGARSVVSLATNRFWKSIGSYVEDIDQAFSSAWSQTLRLHSPTLSCSLEPSAGPYKQTWIFRDSYEA